MENLTENTEKTENNKKVEIEEIEDLTKNTENIKKEEKPKTIVFCIAGNEFNTQFLLNWSNLLSQCFANGYMPIMRVEYDRDIYINYNKCLGANLLNFNPEQKPFSIINNFDYDYIVFIKPNMEFDFFNLQKLLESPYDITTSIYTYESKYQTNKNNLTNLVANHNNNLEFYKNRGTYNFIPYDSLINANKIDNRYINVDYADIGFMVIKKGVLDKVSYPWFDKNINYDNKDKKTGISDIHLFTESYSFCYKLRQAGFKITADCNTKLKYFD
jgi:hypothetical protein